jgi:catechol 2,3-dioxygenase-like lactoylglutathione lyase family enzyme
MVANGAKPMALSKPQASINETQIERYKKIAEDYQVALYVEDSFPKTLLFDHSQIEGKDVVVIYREGNLKRYLQLKNDIQNSRQPADDFYFARRLGRLLGYDSQGINRLLRQNTSYTNPFFSKVSGQITHLFYDNLKEAHHFYSTTLGLKETSANRFQIGNDTFLQLNHTNDSIPQQEIKSTAVAFLTDNLPGWYEYVQQKNIPVKYTYKPKDGGPHDGFVAIDPEGYLLEFEMFKQHPENEPLMAALLDLPKISTISDSLNFYASIIWTYHKDVLKMQNFYEEVLGYQLVADQGWTKIYQTSSSGFIGLVDECRGMEDYSKSKPVRIDWLVRDRKFIDYWKATKWTSNVYESTLVGPDNYRYNFREEF